MDLESINNLAELSPNKDLAIIASNQELLRIIAICGVFRSLF